MSSCNIYPRRRRVENGAISSNGKPLTHPSTAEPPTVDEAAPIGTNLPVTKETPDSSAPPPPTALTVPAPPAPKVDEHGMSATSGPLGDHLAGEEFGLGAPDDGEEETGGGKAEEGVRSELDAGAVEGVKAEGGAEGKSGIEEEKELAEMEGDKVARVDGARGEV